MKISIIIATRNEQRNLKRCIDSLKAQDHPDFEILVVDCHSSDSTPAIAAELGVRTLTLEPREAKAYRNPRGAQVNQGVENTEGEIIFFPDADMSFDPQLLSEAARLFESKEIGALYIPEQIEGAGFFGRIRNHERGFYTGTCIDAARFVRRSVFEKIGGFDTQNVEFGPDDWDLDRRIRATGFRVSKTKNQLYHHEEDLKLRDYLRKKGKYVPTFDAYRKKWKNDLEIRKQLGFSYRYFGVFLENGKWKNLLRSPLLSLSVFFLRVLVGFRFIQARYFRRFKVFSMN